MTTPQYVSLIAGIIGIFGTIAGLATNIYRIKLSIRQLHSHLNKQDMTLKEQNKVLGVKDDG